MKAPVLTFREKTVGITTTKNKLHFLENIRTFLKKFVEDYLEL